MYKVNVTRATCELELIENFDYSTYWLPCHQYSESYLTIDTWFCLSDKIVVGSHNGCLRIYYPRVRDGNISGYRPEDCICEVQLNDPILQVDIGKFASYDHL